MSELARAAAASATEFASRGSSGPSCTRTTTGSFAGWRSAALMSAEASVSISIPDPGVPGTASKGDPTSSVRIVGSTGATNRSPSRARISVRATSSSTV